MNTQKLGKYIRRTIEVAALTGIINAFAWQGFNIKEPEFYKDYNERMRKYESSLLYDSKQTENPLNSYLKDEMYPKIEKMGTEEKEFIKSMAPYLETIAQNCEKYDINPFLAQAVAYTESHFKPDAKSRNGAMGLFQINDVTAKHLGINPNNVNDNIKGGIKYLSEMLEQFDGDVRFALAAYNMGPTKLRKTIRKYGNDWDIVRNHVPKETRNYIKKTMRSKRFVEEVCNELGIDEIKYFYTAKNIKDVLMEKYR